jgi:hypothetical protein
MAKDFTAPENLNFYYGKTRKTKAINLNLFDTLLTQRYTRALRRVTEIISYYYFD